MLLQSDENWLGSRLEPPYGRGLNLQMELSDIAPIYERLLANGTAMQRDFKDVWREAGDILTGQREFYVQDPDGYLLRFCQPLGDKRVRLNLGGKQPYGFHESLPKDV